MNTFVVIGIVAFIVIFRIANAAARQAQKQAERAKLGRGSTGDASPAGWEMMPTAQAPRKPNLPPELQAEIARAMRAGKLPTHKVQKARPVTPGPKPAAGPAIPERDSLTLGAGSLFANKTSVGATDESLFANKTSGGATDATLFANKTSAGATDAALFRDKTTATETADASTSASARSAVPMLADRSGVRQAILVSEILGPPVSLRRGLGRDGN